MEAMGTFLGNVGTVVSQIINWIGSALDLITSNPFLLFTVGFLALGGAIGMIGRLIQRG